MSKAYLRHITVEDFITEHHQDSVIHDVINAIRPDILQIILDRDPAAAVSTVIIRGHIVTPLCTLVKLIKSIHHINYGNHQHTRCAESEYHLIVNSYVWYILKMLLYYGAVLTPADISKLPPCVRQEAAQLQMVILYR